MSAVCTTIPRLPVLKTYNATDDFIVCLFAVWGSDAVFPGLAILPPHNLTAVEVPRHATLGTPTGTDTHPPPVIVPRLRVIWWRPADLAAAVQNRLSSLAWLLTQQPDADVVLTSLTLTPDCAVILPAQHTQILSAATQEWTQDKMQQPAQPGVGTLVLSQATVAGTPVVHLGTVEAVSDGAVPPPPPFVWCIIGGVVFVLCLLALWVARSRGPLQAVGTSAAARSPPPPRIVG